MCTPLWRGTMAVYRFLASALNFLLKKLVCLQNANNIVLFVLAPLTNLSLISWAVIPFCFGNVIADPQLGVVVVVVVVVFTLKTVLTSIQYPSLSYSSRQRNEFPWSHANPK